MPIYDYHCSSCGSDFELLVRSETKPTCPSCGASRLERRLSLPARASSGGRSAGDSEGGATGGGCCGGSCHVH